ncbi:MAG: DNA polymerase III subunit delta' [Pseudomonadota bacterium]
MTADEENAEPYPSPQKRENQVGREDVEAELSALLASGNFSHGWLVCGPSGAGKATLGFRLLRAYLSPDDRSSPADLSMPATARTFRLIANDAHPDFFVAERLWDEKKGRRQSDITVDTIRKLSSFLNKTPALGGRRAAMIDTADDLNRNAANALLKLLEEPPANTLILLLSTAPGRLLATIRSRCRRFSLPPLSRDAIMTLLRDETHADVQTAETIADHAAGRPGYALRLAQDDGAAGVQSATRFVASISKQGDVSAAIAMVAGKAADAQWPIFSETLVTMLSDAARRSASEGQSSGPLAKFSVPQLLAAHEAASSLLARGEALNLDRRQLCEALAYDLSAALEG